MLIIIDPITQVHIDEEDRDLIHYTWCLNDKGYVVGRVNGKTEWLHKLIAKRVGLSQAVQIDHKDRNKLNCRRNNLREATNEQNQMNGNVHSNNLLGIRGIYYRKKYQRYEVRIQVNKTPIYIGSFIVLEEAIQARSNAEKKYFKDFAP